MRYDKHNYASLEAIQPYDEFVFCVRGRYFGYRLKANHFENFDGSGHNGDIFTALGVDKIEFCTSAYGYMALDGGFPKAYAGDSRALLRVIKALFNACAERESRPTIYHEGNYHRLTNTFTGDRFIFEIDGAGYSYANSGRYLNDLETGQNERIFDLLGLDKDEFCALHYGYAVDDNGGFPETRRNDSEALLRVIIALFQQCKIGKIPELPLVFGKREGLSCDGCFSAIEDKKYKLVSGQHICNKCSVKIFSCSICSELTNGRRFATINTKTKAHLCNDCATRKGSANINNHSHRPHPLYFANDYVGKNTYFGWELEVESGNTDISDISNTFRDRRLYFKLDSSINEGVEIVSHPMTFSYMKTHKEFFVQLLKGLEKTKCKSADTQTCGMHIHVSKDGVSQMQLWKMLDFFRKNKKFVYTMSGRTSVKQLNRYASLGKISKGAQPKMARKFWDGADKYTAINILPNKTIEFRIFKGTLNPKKFFKNIEFVDSLLEWTRVESLRGITASNYCQYIKDNKRKYPNVLQYMEDNEMIKLKRGVKSVIAEM